MFGLAQVTGLMASTLNAGRYLVKDEKTTIIALMGVHLFFGVTFMLLSIFPGAFVCFLLGILYMINYIFKYYDKDVPHYILLLYAIVCVAFGMLSSKTYFLNVFPSAISLLVIANILFKDNRRAYRVLEIAQQVLWTIYSISVGAYTITISNILFVFFMLKDIYKYDINSAVEPTLELEIDLAKEEAEREKAKEESFQKSKEKLEEGNTTGDILLTSKLLNNYRTSSTISPHIKGKRILGRRGNHSGTNGYSKYKKL